MPERDRPRSAAGAIVLVALAAMGLAGAYAGGRLIHHDGDPSWWVRAGEELSVASELPEGFYQEDGLGYDGQFYYRLARAPLSLDDRVDGIELDRPAYRHQRLGYPLLAWALAGGGRADAVPWTLPLVNLLAVGVLAAATACIAVDAGRSAWWGLPVAFVPGALTALAFDLAEAVEVAAVVVAVLLLRRQRFGSASAVMAFAVLVRETSLLLPLGVLAAALLTRVPVARRWDLARRDGDPPAWVAIAPVGVYVATQVLMDRWWGIRGGGAGKSAEQLHPPFTALAEELTSLASSEPLHAVALFAILVGGALGLVAVWQRVGPAHERLAILGATALTSLLGVWDRAIVYMRYPTLWLVLGYLLLLSAPLTPTARSHARIAAGLLIVLGTISVILLGEFPIPSMEVG